MNQKQTLTYMRPTGAGAHCCEYCCNPYNGYASTLESHNSWLLFTGVCTRAHGTMLIAGCRRFDRHAPPGQHRWPRYQPGLEEHTGWKGRVGRTQNGVGIGANDVSALISAAMELLSDADGRDFV